MNQKSKEEKPTTAPVPTPAKKLYLIRADDIERLETHPEDSTLITCIHLKPGGRVVQIDDSPQGRGMLTSNIRRIVGDKVTTKLISGAVTTEKKGESESLEGVILSLSAN